MAVSEHSSGPTLNATNQLGSTGRRRKLSGDSVARCQCGCNIDYEMTNMVWCKGGTRRVDPTGCQKRIGKICCPRWICIECDRRDTAKINEKADAKEA
jgi:hypothetical protein